MGRVLCCLLLLLPAPMSARSAVLPQLRGQLTGKLALQGFADAPVLDWRLQAQPLADGDTHVRALVTAPGLSAELEFNVAAADGAVTWQLKRGQIDLARWWRPMAMRMGLKASMPGDLSAGGRLNLKGEGRWTEAGIAGTISVDGADVSLGSVEQNWSVPALKLNARVELASRGAILRKLQLNVPKAIVAGLELTDATVVATGDTPHQVAVKQASIALLDGTLALQPFEFDPTDPQIKTTVELRNLALHDLAAFVPEALSVAQGRMNGRVDLRWSAARGFQPQAGALTMASDTPASLRLAASPGFLTQHMPARIVWLPGWLGGLAQRWALDNPAYDTLRGIELGRLPLVVEALQVELYPDGPAGARSAVAQVTARPAGGSAVERVTFAVNVSGPLNAVLRLGTDKRVRLQMGLKP